MILNISLVIKSTSRLVQNWLDDNTSEFCNLKFSAFVKKIYFPDVFSAIFFTVIYR